MTPEERRAATKQRVTSGQLPPPRWFSVQPDSRVMVDCDGCGEAIKTGEYAFTVVLLGSLTFHFHDECFDVYNRTPSGTV